MKKRIRKKPVALLIAMLAAVMLLTTACGSGIFKAKVRSALNPIKIPDLNLPKPEVETQDAKTYYEERGTIVETADLSQSNVMLSEAEVYKMLTERGFDQNPITTSLDRNGDYIDEKRISSSSKDKHPVYETEYTSADGMSWIIMVISDKVVADPIYFNFVSQKYAETIVAENENVTSYDGVTKQFFVTSPSEAALIIKRVDKITSQSLDRMTMEELNK